MNIRTVVIDCFDLYSLIKHQWKGVPDVQLQNYLNAAFDWCLDICVRDEPLRILSTSTLGMPAPTSQIQDLILAETKNWIGETLANVKKNERGALVKVCVTRSAWAGELSFDISPKQKTPQDELFDLIRTEIEEGHHYPVRIRAIIEKNQQVISHAADG